MSGSAVRAQPITLQLPEALYQRVQAAAEAQHQPLEDVLLDAVNTGLLWLDDLPADQSAELAALARLNDSALWREARRALSAEQQADLSDLLEQQGRGDLDTDTQRTLNQLLGEYQRLVLIRAQAAVLLKQRGYELSEPRVLNEPTPTYS